MFDLYKLYNYAQINYKETFKFKWDNTISCRIRKKNFNSATLVNRVTMNHKNHLNLWHSKIPKSSKNILEVYTDSFYNNYDWNKQDFLWNVLFYIITQLKSNTLNAQI